MREHTNKTPVNTKSNSEVKASNKYPSKSTNTDKKFSKEIEKEISEYTKAGEIAKKITEYAKSIIKPDMLLTEIVEKINKEIEKNKAKPAFPVNLSINEVAAHYHPTLEDETKANGLLKVDIGIEVNGFIADTAFSLDLTKEKKYTDLIKASQEALENALKLVESDPSLSEIGNTIQETISKKGFSPVINLSGHSLAPYTIHAGITIPNSENNSTHKLPEGAYAIEPFATTGEGKVIDGPPSNIYAIINPRTPRSPSARAILEYVWEEHQTLPFSLLELQKIFGNISRLAIRELVQQGIVHDYPQLIEITRHPVSQAEHTFLKLPDGTIKITTK